MTLLDSRHALALRIAPWLGGIDRIGEERDELRAALMEAIETFYDKDDPEWNAYLEAVDYLLRENK